MRPDLRTGFLLGFLALLLVWSPSHLYAGTSDARPVSFTEPSDAPAQAAPVQVSLPDTTVQEGRTIHLPLRVEGAPAEEIAAYQFTLTYDPDVVTLTGVETENTLSSSGSISVGQSEGEIRVAYASSDVLENAGTLLIVKAKVADPGQTVLAFQGLLLFDQNGQELDATADSPRLTVEPDDTPPEAPGDLSAAPEDTDVLLSWTAPSSDDVARQLVYRGTTADFDTTGARLQTLDSLATNFTTSAPPSGTSYYYRLAAVDVAGNTSPLSPLTSALSVQISRSFSDASSTDGYQLVALPGASGRPLASTLSGAPGTAWQAWWDNGSDSDFLVRFDGSDRFNFSAGRGFWLISTNDWSVDGTLAGATIRNELTTTIPLHDGWNIIANPVPQDVAWSAVETANEATLQALWQWDGGFTETATFRSATNGEAFYFLNDQNLEELVIPLPGASATAEVPHEAEKNEDVSALRLDVIQAGATASRIQVGFRPEAKRELDAYDQFAPPSRFESASLRLVAPGASQSGRLRYLAHEWRAPAEDGESFDLVLQSDPGSSVRLRAANLSALDSRKVVLINPETGRSHDLRQTPTVTLQPDQKETRLRLAIGSAAFVENETEKATPDRLTLRPSYPNPFRSQTTLEYALPTSADVRIAIYDVLGRRVRVLAEGDHTAGRHDVTWDGRNNAGQPVASGLYLIRLESDGQTRLQKATLLR